MHTVPDESIQRPSLEQTLESRITGLVQRLAPPWLVQLSLRLALAVPFWKSGRLKWEGFLELNETAITLFTDVFQLHLPGGPYPFPLPATFAFLAGCAEVILPALLVLGAGARIAAVGLLVMTCVVQLTVPEGWAVHATWAAMAMAVAAWGPGCLSVDHLLGGRKIRAVRPAQY